MIYVQFKMDYIEGEAIIESVVCLFVVVVLRPASSLRALSRLNLWCHTPNYTVCHHRAKKLTLITFG